MRESAKPLLAVTDETGALRYSPAWMDAWQRLGATIARKVTPGVVPGTYRRLVIAVSTPCREYAALVTALGMVRMSYRDRVLPDPRVQFSLLAGLPKETMVRAVLGRTKVELGPVSGSDARGRLRFGRKLLDAGSCADIRQIPSLPHLQKELRFDLDYDSAFLKNMMPSADPLLFATEARTACVVVGPGRDLEDELCLRVARPGGSTEPRPVREVLRPYCVYGQRGWQSDVVSSQVHDWQESVRSRHPRLVILDGAASVQRWLVETYDAGIVVALVHRSDSSASAAAEALLNERRSAEPVAVGALPWEPPAACEAFAFGEPA
jgi:hypothetical protein